MIAITGLGAVCGLGHGVDALFEGLCAGRSSITTPAPFGGRGVVSLEPGGEDRLTTDLALEAAREALAGLDDRGDVACVGGSTSGDMRAGEEAHFLANRGGDPPPRDLVWRQLCHEPTRRVAETLGLGGVRLTLSTACTSGAAAVGVAADLVRVGLARRVLALGADALCQTTLHGFGALGLHSQEACLPFGAGRKGMSLGEGAGALLVEDLDTALARGARPLALLAGYANTSDAHHLSSPHPEGLGAVEAMRQALGDRPPSSVSFVCAHATGTELNDAMEARAIQEVFGEPGPWVAGYKGAFGHTLGAAGALEAVIAVLAVARGRIPPSTRLLEPAFPLRFADRVVDGPVSGALSVNFAFGGNNTALLVTPWTA